MTHSRFDAHLIEAAPRNFVLSTQLGDELALLDLRSNVYFSLTEVGTVIWDAIQQPSTRSAVVERVLALYDVTEEQCAGDVDALLDELWEAKLIALHPPAAP